MVDVWKVFCNENFQLMVICISICHCIMELKQIWTNWLLIEEHFHFATTLSQCNNCKKGLWRTKLNGSLCVKFCKCKKATMKKIYIKIFNFFSNCEKKHLLVHYVIIMMKIVIFLSCKMFFHWRCTWIKFFLIILH